MTIRTNTITRRAENDKLSNMRIAISVSDHNADIHALQYATEYLCGNLLLHGAALAYAGDLRNGGYTRMLSRIAYEYRFLNEAKVRFINYFSYPVTRGLSLSQLSDLRSFSDARIMKIPTHVSPHINPGMFDPQTVVSDRYIAGECLSDMRLRMARETHARVVLGGSLKQYTGYYPGIVEETFHSLAAGKPVYIIGGFGGAAKAMADMVCGRQAISLKNDYHFDTCFKKSFRNFAAPKTAMKLDYEYLAGFFRHYSLERFSWQNGLTPDENRILFETTDTREVLSLVIKGMSQL